MTKLSQTGSSAHQTSDLLDAASDMESMGSTLWARIVGAFSKVSIHRTPRRLRICETISLGEKRLVAVVQCEHRRFLIGATAHHIALLQTLDGEKPIDPESDPA